MTSRRSLTHGHVEPVPGGFKVPSLVYIYARKTMQQIDSAGP
ncbi:MAG: hypothetical protein PVH66_02870 [Methyloceanibacter sp.]